MQSIHKTQQFVRRRAPQRIVHPWMIAIFFFCLGFYAGEASHRAPDVIDAVQQAIPKGD